MPARFNLVVAAAVIAASLSTIGAAEASQIGLGPAVYRFDQIKHTGTPASFGLMNPGVTLGFNPQPDPPGDGTRILNPANFVAAPHG